MPNLITYFAIGASFLWDSQPKFYPNVYDHLQGGWHIRSSSPMEDIWNDPDTINVPSSSYGKFTEALPNNLWDALVFQTHPAHSYSQSQYIAAESAALQNFLTLNNNPLTKVFIYAAWPIEEKLGQWYAPNVGGEINKDLWDQETYQAFFDAVAPTIPNPVYLIPTGNIFANMPEGTDLYRDANSHASVFMQNVLKGTVATVLSGEYDPERIHPVAWLALLNEPRSGVSPSADFDGDGDVDNADLTHSTLGWETRYGDDLDGNDFLAWQREYGSGVGPLGAVSVPEPATLLLLIWCFVGIRRKGLNE